ncbi:carbohydrate ABC transporter permease [Staphylococcus felis]|uniref:Carbohydrate ABC transporter permease n=1 Tax=Staphylococcus felis TaxID=46127 RepID=A0AAX1RTW1_9STAP|nr:carbohydrate ABC transporter permease [Staphylococcus felis]REH78563.1 carbohydrate ABC transporter permease [Staphylococcus felis]REH79205.1 carbohydrate ABC transporter permease [Staphylococcus felis]REH81891.1 carbohydrate ABC transporter permease [Staphylococcus felis]REH94203.1 carbohydrate ABC transporter permease [Staphylococcus felis]REH97246.1 carbohydrate ABC transporter permease [Staphylococcus felis]
MKIKQDMSSVVIRTISWVIIIFLTLTILLPMFHIIALAFNSGADAQRGGITFWPRQFSLDNFKEIFRQGTILNALWISLGKTILGTILSVILTAMAAYALTIKTLPFRRVITFGLVFTMLFSAGVVPLYILLHQLSLTDTFWVYIIPSLYSVYHILIMRTFFTQIPNSVIEAARIDGCNDWQIFWKIILPMSKPVIATITLFNAVSQWNDWFTGAFFVRNPQLKPLATVLQDMLTSQESISHALKQKAGAYQMIERMTITGDSLQMAMIVLLIIPVLFLFPFVQKHFVKGVNIGSTKE